MESEPSSGFTGCISTYSMTFCYIVHVFSVFYVIFSDLKDDRSPLYESSIISCAASVTQHGATKKSLIQFTFYFTRMIYPASVMLILGILSN